MSTETTKVIKPITPDEVVMIKKEIIPPEAIESFNELIAEKWNGRDSRVEQNEVVKRMIDKGINRTCIYSNSYLDVEDIYRAAGWLVRYCKPAYNEDYPSFFQFTKKKS